MYHEIATDLIRAIEAGRYRDKLPTEKNLMAIYKVSRNTIRRAIDVVYQHGLLRRVQGSGYYINELQLSGQLTINLSIGAGKSLMRHGPLTSKVVTFDKVLAAEIPLAKELAISPSAGLWRVVRLRYLNGQLYCLEEAYFVRAIIPFIATNALGESLFDFVKDTYDIVPSSSDDFMSLTPAAPDQADLMESPPNTPLLTLAQINYTTNSDLFNFSKTLFAYPGLNFYFHSARITSN